MSKEDRQYFIVPIASCTRALCWAAIQDSPRTARFGDGTILLKFPSARAEALGLTGGLSLEALHASGLLDVMERSWGDLTLEEQVQLGDSADLDPARDRDAWHLP